MAATLVTAFSLVAGFNFVSDELIKTAGDTVTAAGQVPRPAITQKHKHKQARRRASPSPPPPPSSSKKIKNVGHPVQTLELLVLPAKVIGGRASRAVDEQVE